MIPKSFTDRYTEKAKGCRMFGVPLEELSREELMACVVAGWESEKLAIEEGSRQRKFLLSLRRN